MTLIVGVLCSDGVVVGSDGAATLGALGAQTARQATHKLTVIDDAVIVGVSGAVGLAQRIVAEVTSLRVAQKLKGSVTAAMGVIRTELWKHVKIEFETAQTAQQVIGQLAHSPALCFTVVALALDKQPCLIQFDQQTAPEHASDDLPFVAIGSGQQIADPFLGFLRRVFWSNRLPTLAEGRFSTMWTLRHAIGVHPGGVADPIQMTVLERKPGESKWSARELGLAELQEHEEAISAAERYLSDFSKPTPMTQVPPVPEPPAIT